MLDVEMLDQLFRMPFFTGLFLSVSITIMGALLRLREEWLAGLGLPHVAAAGGVAGLPLGLPTTLSATLATSLAALAKALVARSDNGHFALMLVLGWGGALFLAANTYQGEMISEGLLRGQLYFSTPQHFYGALALLATLLGALPWLSRQLLIARFFPDHHSANRQPVWPHELAFAALLVATVVLGTLAVGALPAFALFFVPAWVAFRLARGWKQGMILTVALGVTVYIVAFFIALLLDQPFGPSLALLLALTALLRLYPNRVDR